MRIQTIALAVTALFSLSAQASISLNSAQDTYSQDFNTLSQTGTNNAWANNTTLSGWEVYRQSPSANPSFANSIAATLYSPSTGSSNAGGLYSFGASGNSDRALGTIGSNNAAAGNYWHLLGLTNTSALAFNGLTLSYQGEQWRNSAAPAQTVQLHYGFGSSAKTVSNWIATGFDFTSPIVGAGLTALDGNANAITLGGTLALNWEANQTLWLRWTDVDHTGSDHGLAIDNVSLSVSAVPEPQTYALMLAGLAVIGALARRRKL